MKNAPLGLNGEAMSETNLVDLDAWRSSRRPKPTEKLPTGPRPDTLSFGAWDMEIFVFWRVAQMYMEGKRQGDMEMVAEAMDELDLTRMYSEHARLRARCDDILQSA